MKPIAGHATTFADLEPADAARLVLAASDLTLVLDRAGTVIDVAWSAADLERYGCAEWVGRPWTEIVTVESRQKVEALLRDAGGDTPPRWRHVNHPSPGGEDLPMQYTAVVLRGRGSGAAAGATVFFGRDLRGVVALQQRLVDAQQTMERDYWKFRQAEARYRHLFQVAGEAVVVLDGATLKVLEANPAAQQLLGDGTRSLAGRGFPFGFDDAGTAALQAMLATVRVAGAAEDVAADLAGGRGRVRISASAFRQQGAVQILVRIARSGAERAERAVRDTSAMLAELALGAPDALVVTDADGRIAAANPAFVELVQLGGAEAARGESLDRWLGRTGVDLSVLISNLRQRGAVRLFATTLRGEFGSTTEVEISATMLSRTEPTLLGFTIRDVGRRLAGNHRGGRELPRSVGQLTELVGRVPLKDIVGETTDLIEQLCIEAALELTRDNRASAAEMLGLSRQSLYVKLRRYGLGDLGSEAEKGDK